MTWTKIDSALPDDPRLVRLPRGVRWMHVEAMVWCNQHGTDGHVPGYMLRRITDEEDPVAAAALLVDAKLWRATHDGWTIIDFAKDQPSAADVERGQVLARERQRRQRLHRSGVHDEAGFECDPRYCREASRVTTAVTNGVSHDTRTDPTRTDPKGRYGDGEVDASGSGPDTAARARPSPPPSEVDVRRPPSGSGNPEWDADRFAVWEDAAGDAVLTLSHEVTCSSYDDEEWAIVFAESRYHDEALTEDYTPIPKHDPDWLVLKAWMVEQIEPGRVLAVLATARADQTQESPANGSGEGHAQAAVPTMNQIATTTGEPT